MDESKVIDAEWHDMTCKTHSQTKRGENSEDIDGFA